jgi:hypothetical protein
LARERKKVVFHPIGPSPRRSGFGRAGMEARRKEIRQRSNPPGLEAKTLGTTSLE